MCIRDRDEITANEIMSSILSVEDLTSIVVTHKLDENVLKRYDRIIAPVSYTHLDVYKRQS